MADGERMLLSVKQVGRMLDCSRKTIMRLVTEGKLPKPVLLSKKSPRWYRVDVEYFVLSLQRQKDANV